MIAAAPGPAAIADALSTPQVAAYVLLAVVAVLAAARLVGGVFVRLGQPRVAGEMIAGILVGPTLLGGQVALGPPGAVGPAGAGHGLADTVYPPQAYAVLSVLGLLALVLFTFLVGLEVPQHALRADRGRILLIGAAVVAAPLGLGVVLAGVLDEPGVWRVAAVPGTAHALFLGAAVASTALPVIALLLRERGLSTSRVGVVGLGASALTTPLVFLAVAAAVAATPGGDRGPGMPARVVLTGVLVAALFGAARPLMRRVLAHRFHPDRPLDGDVLAMLLVGALLSGLAAEVLGVHALTGGFLFGLAVPAVPGLAAAVVGRMHQFVVVLLIPLFLAVSGLQTDLRSLRWELLGGLAAFLAAIAAGKWLVGSVVARVAGLDWRQSAAVGSLLCCGGLVTLAVGLVGRQQGLVTEAVQAVLAVSAIATTLLAGPALRHFVRGARPTAL